MFDAVLLASYGGPEGAQEIEPFLDKILSGKHTPPERRVAVVERYLRFNGISPLPNECRRFLSELQNWFKVCSKRPKLYWGNLYSPPTFEQALSQMEADSVKSALVFPTSAFGSPQSCQRYRLAVQEALEKRTDAFTRSCEIAFTPPFFDLPTFCRVIADELLTALAYSELDAEDPFGLSSVSEKSKRLILFSAHSLPTADGKESQYKRQLMTAATTVLRTMLNSPAYGRKEAADVNSLDGALLGFPKRKTLLANGAQEDDFDPETKALLLDRSLDAAIVFQSRSGSPTAPWLGPSIGEFLREYKKQHQLLKQVVVSPLGFFFENMETIYDLDVEFREICNEMEIEYRRALCCGSSSRLIELVFQLALLDPKDFPHCRCSEGTCDLSCRL